MMLWYCVESSSPTLALNVWDLVLLQAPIDEAIAVLAPSNLILPVVLCSEPLLHLPDVRHLHL